MGLVPLPITAEVTLNANTRGQQGSLDGVSPPPPLSNLVPKLHSIHNILTTTSRQRLERKFNIVHTSQTSLHTLSGRQTNSPDGMAKWVEHPSPILRVRGSGGSNP